MELGDSVTMRYDEINGVDEGILDRARRGVRKLRNTFSKPQSTQNSAPQVEPTMDEIPDEKLTGGTAGAPRGGFLSGLAKGIGSPELANALDASRASNVTNGAFPFPSSVPAADAAMGNTPPPVNEPAPKVKKTVRTTGTVKPSAGANAFGQMTKQLNVIPPTSTGGALANTQTGITHTASPNNPNQPVQTTTTPVASTTTAAQSDVVPNTNFGLRNIPPKSPTPNFSRGQQTATPAKVTYNMPTAKKPVQQPATVAEGVDLAEILWRKMKSKR